MRRVVIPSVGTSRYSAIVLGTSIYTTIVSSNNQHFCVGLSDLLVVLAVAVLSICCDCRVVTCTL